MDSNVDVPQMVYRAVQLMNLHEYIYPARGSSTPVRRSSTTSTQAALQLLRRELGGGNLQSMRRTRAVQPIAL